MIAEIKGKISRSGSNLSEKLEDELTGNIFGNLRYLLFSEVLKPIFVNGIYPQSVAKRFEKINEEYWADKIEFWPQHNYGELDAYIEFDDIAVGIEAKYTSSLSSDDDVDYSKNEEEKELLLSRNQIQRECRILEDRAKNKLKIILLIADMLDCSDIYQDIDRRELLKKSDVLFGYISWQSILVELQKLYIDNAFSKIIISDLVDLMKRKGFDQFEKMQIVPINVDSNKFYVFTGMHEDYFDFTMKNDWIMEGDEYYEFR